MSHLSKFRIFWKSFQVFFQYKWGIDWWARKIIHHSCEGGIEKSVPRDPRLSSPGQSRDAIRWSRDGFLYPTLILMKDSYNPLLTQIMDFLLTIRYHIVIFKCPQKFLYTLRFGMHNMMTSRHLNVAMKSLVFWRTVVRVLSFPRTATGCIKENSLRWVKKAETPKHFFPRLKLVRNVLLVWWGNHCF